MDRNSRPVLLIGIIDRVDLERDHPSRAFVFDYKTGMAQEPRAKNQVGGRSSLQLAVWIRDRRV